MLALYVAMRIGLPRPFWAMMTSYVVANPFSGPVRSKAVYRVGGTILGSLATVVLVPPLANAPELLSLVMALWVGGCLYLALLDRTPRSYVFMLAGYTAALIAFPAVGDPSTIFDVALARVEEILLGIVCATLVHSLVFPQSFGPVLLARLDHAIRDARQWIVDALTSGDLSGQDRRKLAGDITELRLMAVHLPFDTSHLRWTAQAIHALQDRLAAMVPLLSAIEDRLHALRQIDGATLAARWNALLKQIADWGQDEPDGAAASSDALHRRIDDITPAIAADASWTQLLEVNLAARLHTLVATYEECRNLRRHIAAGQHGPLPAEARRQSAVAPGMLHLDHGLALMSSLAAVIAILACCAFWIGTAWPTGSAAAMMAAVFCCFFATQDDPVPGIKLFLKYTLVSVPISALYLLAILPAVHSFEMLALVIAPVFLFLGVHMARPATGAKAAATLFGVAGSLALQDTNAADLASFLNSMLAQIAGIMAAVVFTRLLRTVSATWTARRLLRAGWDDLARLGSAEQAPPMVIISARMLDRVGLLTPRLALAGVHADLQATDALIDLQVGLNMAQLQRVQSQRGDGAASVRPLLRQLAESFRQRARQAASASPALLACVDATLQAMCADRPPAASKSNQREAVVAITGVRRDLFPDAPPYQPLPIDTKESR